MISDPSPRILSRGRITRDLMNYPTNNHSATASRIQRLPMIRGCLDNITKLKILATIQLARLGERRCDRVDVVARPEIKIDLNSLDRLGANGIPRTQNRSEEQQRSAQTSERMQVALRRTKGRSEPSPNVV